MLTWEYIPWKNGAEIYFKACELDQHRATTISVADVPDTQIMVAAQIVFSREVDNNRMQEIDDKREQAHTNTAIYISPATKYTRFKEHYSKYLGEWYLNTHLTRNKKGQQAYITDSLTLQLDQLHNDLDMTVHNVNTIAATQDKMLSQNEVSYTPRVYAQVPCQRQPPQLLMRAAP